jgi:hypothetical protein
MSSLVGHTAQRTSLERLFGSGRLPTTMMFAGPAGIGKQKLAHLVASSLLCERAVFGGCDECAACRLIAHSNHPDLRVVECGSPDESNVAAIREVLYSLHLKAYAGTRRVVLFNDAESMSVQTANTLLKHFEEPRPHTSFILVCANPAELPATLLSRCQIWFFDRLSDEAVGRYLESHPELTTYEGETIDPHELIALADGSLADIALLREHLPLWRDLREKLTRIRAGDGFIAHDVAQTLGKKKDVLPAALLLMRIFARQELHRSSAPADRSVWAMFLTNVLTAQTLILERNLAAPPVLHLAFVHLAGRPELGSWPTLTHGGSPLKDALL